MAQSLPIVDTYAETAMQRALQADRFSPTKISPSTKSKNRRQL